MTEQVPAPVAVLGQVLSLMRAGSSDVNQFGTGGGASGVTGDPAPVGERAARRR